ncbi:hypothetical protein SOVF_052150 [Spinacia oleracea]|nr:hypothetical protein SOVF_052150 [Spinacia oleracea]
MASAMLKKLVCLAVICMVVETLMAPHAVEAVVTCNLVAKSLAQCIPYLKGSGGPRPSPNCCAGVQGLKAAAQTTADRRAACNCMKNQAANTKGLNYNLAARLASQCNVRVNYNFDPKTNCNR